MIHKSGQAEIALIAGLAIIAVLVAVYSMSYMATSPGYRASLTAEQRAVDSYVRGVVTDAATDTLFLLYDQGGYLDPSGVRRIEYAGDSVPYWQLCGETVIPPARENFKEGVKNSLKLELPGTTSIAGGQVVFDLEGLEVDSEFFDSKIVLRITLPTAVGGQQMPQPYVVDVPAKFSRILNFARDFSVYQAADRKLDTNLRNQIILSNPESECWLPTSGSVAEPIFRKSWATLRDCMQEVIFHTLSRTYEWENYEVTEGDVIPESILHNVYIYALRRPDNTWVQYADLDAEFYYGGNRDVMTKSNPQLYFNSEPDPVIFGPDVPLIPAETGYDVKYDVSFPVVISVHDELLGHAFKFTNFINMRGTEPSDACSLDEIVDENGNVVEPDNSYYEECEAGLTEEVNLRVVDYSNMPQNDIIVNFGLCPLGKTGIDGLDGRLRAFVKPGLEKPLTFLKSSPAVFYSECKTSEEAAALDTVQVPMEKGFAVHFYTVGMRKSGYLFYIEGFGQTLTKNIDVAITRLGNDCMEPVVLAPLSNHMRVTASGDVIDEMVLATTMDIPATDTYNATLSFGDLTVDDESFVIDYTKSVIYVYAPSVALDVSVSEDALERNIMNLFDACGIGPLSHVKYTDVNTGGCRIPWSP